MTETATIDGTASGEPIQDMSVKIVNNDARRAAELIPVGGTGVEMQNFAQQVDYAKHMSGAAHAIPKHLRGNVGACLAVLDMSQRWGFSPFQVARLCYVVNDILAFESQLVHAVVEKFAPLRERLRPIYDGEGATRTCKIIGHFRGEAEPLEYTSPEFANIKPKNSPLWGSDPDQQLFYFSTQRWARRYCPDILLGIYGKDEIEDNPHIGADNAKEINPALTRERVSTADRSEGFREGHVHAELADAMPADRMQEVLPAREEKHIAASDAPSTKKPETAKAKPATTKAAKKSEKQAEAKSPVQKQAEAAQAAMPTGKPKTSAEYGMYAANKIDEFTDYDVARAWWDSDEERDMRDHLEVPIKTRTTLANKIDDKFLS